LQLAQSHLGCDETTVKNPAPMVNFVEPEYLPPPVSFIAEKVRELRLFKDTEPRHQKTREPYMSNPHPPRFCTL
jgi:hypothetical protein